jgi:hypothetical protein
MNTLGAIIDTRGPTGRQPWSAAAFLSDSSRFGAALTATSFYGALSAPDLYRARTGAWMHYHGFIVKASFAYFSALHVYFEETGFFSIGLRHLRFLTLSAEIEGTRLHCIESAASYQVAQAGLSAWIPWSWAGISLNLDHISLKPAAVEGGDPPPVFRIGIHTIHSRFGSQGALVSVVPSDAQPVCFAIGEAYQITPVIAFNAAISNNPVMISFGMTVAFGASSMAVGLANHPKLGWSQSMAAEYARR